MNLTEEYQALVRGALLVAESAEDAYRLSGLDRSLKPSVRGRLESLRLLIDGCDTKRQLAEDTRALAQTAAEHSALREQLFRH
jgi:hypothetical protein